MSQKFKLKANPTFSAPIKIAAPGGEEQILNVIFRHKRTADAEAWIKRSDGDQRHGALMEVIEGWDAEDFPFNADNLTELMQEQPGSGQSLTIGYYSALHGAVRKN